MKIKQCLGIILAILGISFFGTTITMASVGATITGHVLEPNGSIFIPGENSDAFVKLRTLDNSNNDICGSGINGDGTFKLECDISTGDYLLMVDAGGNNNPYTNSVPVKVHITSGQALTYDVEFTNPIITGNILNPDGSNYSPGLESWIDVCLRSSDGMDNWTGINNDGHFKYGGQIPQGEYKLYAYPRGVNNPYARSEVLVIKVISEQMINQNVSLTNPMITGRVSKPDGSPFISGNDSFGRVELRDFNGNEITDTNNIENDGTYKLGGSIPTGDYLLTADANGNNNPYSNSKPETIHITAGQTLTKNISLTNPTITGRILKPDGSNYASGQDSWIDVCLRASDGFNNWTGVNNDGYFKYGGQIPQGEYKLYAYPRGVNNPYARSEMAVINVTAEQLINHNIILTTPMISGRVSNPDGTAFKSDNNSDGRVILRDVNGNEVTDTNHIENDGSYKLGGSIPAGQYKLCAEVWGSNNKYTNAIPLILNITASTAITQNITLTSPVITGRVLKPDGSVFIPDNNMNSYVKLRRSDNSGEDICGSGVNNDGTFNLGGNIPTGDYLLMADANGNNNPYSNSKPQTIHITAGQALTKDISLTSTAITGRILKPDGSNYAPGQDSWIDVCLRASNGVDIWTGVNNDGYFKYGDQIPPGEYKLYACPRGVNNPYARSEMVVINVISEQIINHNLTLTTPMIKGLVLNSDGTIFTSGNDSYVRVVLRGENGNEVTSTNNIENDGTYKLGGNLPTGQYKLGAEVWGSNNLYLYSLPVSIHVDLGQVTIKDIRLEVRNTVGTGTISGHVSILTTTEGVFGNCSDVTVSLEGTSIITFTDNNGYYILSNVPVGNYNLTFKKDKFAEELSKDVEVLVGAATQINKTMVLMGDLNRDSIITSNDLIVMKNYLLGKASGNISYDLSNGDMDGDGKITSRDYAWILRIIRSN
jgi:hypothetical protein